MRLVHRSDSDDSADHVLATDLEFAETFGARTRGLMFRRSIPDDYGLVFRFDSAKKRDLHMLFVPFSIDAIWTVEGRVTSVKRLGSWTGLGRARADTIVELPAGAADGVQPGDFVTVVDR